MMIFSLPAGDSRRRRRLKRTGANAPVLTGGLGAVSHQQAGLGIYRGIACYNGEGLNRRGKHLTLASSTLKIGPL